MLNQASRQSICYLDWRKLQNYDTKENQSWENNNGGLNSGSLELQISIIYTNLEIFVRSLDPV